MKRIATLLLAIAAILDITAYGDAASLLPPGKSCFNDASGHPLAAGTITFSIPSTTTPKDTWNSTTQSGGTLNTNPVVLNGAGCAIIYGSGAYREILKDVLGNTLWDVLTYSSGAGSGNSAVIWGGTATGSGNAQVITAGDFNGTDGQVIAYLASATNTSATTIQTSNFAATPIVQDLTAGPTALVGGEITAGSVVMAVYTASGGRFHLINNPQQIKGNTADAAPDPLADYVATYDASASVNKKVLLSNLRPASTASFCANKNGSDQAVGSAGDIQVTFGTEQFDVGGFFASSTWTPPAGKVLLNVNLQLSAVTATTSMTVQIFKNGSLWKFLAYNFDANTPQMNLVDVADGSDTYKVYTSSPGGDAAYTVVGTVSATWFCGSML